MIPTAALAQCTRWLVNREYGSVQTYHGTSALSGPDQPRERFACGFTPRARHASHFGWWFSTLVTKAVS